jgi:hydrogenase expression/formation protein HypD
MEALMGGEARIDGFLCPGHVSVITGPDAYAPLCARRRVPCVVAGFEAADMAEGIRLLLRQIADGRACVEVEYGRSVRAGGNPEARRACDEVFEPCDAEWRGLGVIAGSGLRIREAFAAHDEATVSGGLEVGSAPGGPRGCRCGDVLRGVLSPPDCALFGVRCTPDSPVGPCMVSAEGACAAHFRYGRGRAAS